MADTAKVVERVADRHVKRLTDALEAALPRARGRLSDGALVSALERGRATAMRLVDGAVEDGDLRVLAAKRPMEERLLDVAQESADATRCAVRPTGPGRSTASTVDSATQATASAIPPTPITDIDLDAQEDGWTDERLLLAAAQLLLEDEDEDG